LSRSPFSRVPSFMCPTPAACGNRDGPAPRSRADHTDWVFLSQETHFGINTLKQQKIFKRAAPGSTRLCGAKPIAYQ
jgi:hypothetical protein